MEQLKTSLPLLLVSGGASGNITGVISSLIWFMLAEAIVKNIPILLETIKSFFVRKVSPKINAAMDDGVSSRIIFERMYLNKTQDNIADAIISYICSIDSAKELLFKEFYLANKKEIFSISPDISVRVIDTVFDKDLLSKVKFELFSKTLKLSELKKWCDNIEKNYNTEKKNKFGNTRYFFDELLSDIPLGNTQQIFHFTMTEFHTNKSLKNIYGDHVKILKDRVKLFTENPKWYEKNGIPHTLGILLHGPPGTGKTSIIKAIARDTERHICNIRLREDTMPDQLWSLFHNETVMVKNSNGQFSSVVIPMDKRIYVIEDVDALNKVVLDRKFQKAEDDEKENDDRLKNMIPGAVHKEMKKNKENKKLTLAFLLNLLDGILETPGRILIMTSNFPERLDKALIRPGRVDVNLHLGFCSNSILREMFEGFYGKSEFPFDFKDIRITPAKVQEILCNNIQSSGFAYEELYKALIENMETPQENHDVFTEKVTSDNQDETKMKSNFEKNSTDFIE